MHVFVVEEGLPVQPAVLALPQPARRGARVVRERVAGDAVNRRDPVADGADVSVLQGGELLTGGLLGGGGGCGRGGEGDSREAETGKARAHGNGSLRGEVTVW